MGWCDFWNDNLSGLGKPPACEAKDAATGAVTSAAGSAWESIVHSFQEGAVWMVRELALGWLSADSPTLNQNSGTVAFLFSSTLVLTQWLAVLTLLIAAGKMAYTRRSEPAREAAGAIVRLVVASAAAVAVLNLLTKAGDSFSTWMVNRSLGCPGDVVTKGCLDAFSNKLLEMSTLKNVDQLSISLIIAVLMSLSGLVQLFSVLFRQSLLFVLVGTLPLAAAASGTEQGKSWWTKSLGWLLAFVCYKPAAAIIYATAFSQFQTNDSKQLMPQLYGVTLLIMSAFTLPALMRFIAPVISEGGIGGGGSSGAGGVASRVATGAIALKTGGASIAAKGAVAGAAAGASGAKPAGGSGGSGGAKGGGSGGRPPGGSPPAPSSPPPAPPGGGTPPKGGGATAPNVGSAPPARAHGGSSGAGVPASRNGSGGTPSGAPAQPVKKSSPPPGGPRGSK